MTSQEPSTVGQIHLASADANSVDAVLEARRGGARANAAGLSPDQAQRLERVEKLFALLDHHVAEDPPDSLVNRTLTHISESRQQYRFDKQVETLTMPTSNFGWYELGAVAAAVLIMASLAIPMLSQNRDDARRLACANSLKMTGMAFGAYTSDHENVLPRGPVAPGSTWFRIGAGPAEDGTMRSNSGHLFLLVRGHYADARTLACSENPHAPRHIDANATDWRRHEETSFSYQNQFTTNVFRIDLSPGMAILADKNPLFEIRRGKPLKMRPYDPDTPSEMHRTGQNVLSADGTVRWEVSPVRGNDSIWTIKGVKTYRGTEAPTDPDDTHLVP